jgi:hypothetical protein
VLTAGYAGPATDTNFNRRQHVNPYEITFSSTTVPGATGTLFEVDDNSAQLPSNATSNPIMAQPLYVAGITVSNPEQGSCNSCNMVIAVTLNDTIFAWNADGTGGAGNLLWSRQGAPGVTGNLPGNAGNALWYDDCGLGGSPVRLSSTVLQFMGILSTPVIDASGSTPTMFLTSYCQDSGGNKRWWLHGIDLTTGHDAVTHRRIGGNSGDFTSITEGWQWQRSALLQVKNANNTATPNLIYLLFGTGVSENVYNLRYTGWAVAYKSSATALTPVFAYSDEPTTCGTGGGFLGNGQPNGQCTGNAGTPGCDCYANNSWGSAPNWGGHGGGCWMSGNGPAAAPVGAIKNSGGTSDGAAHVFFGCGNGGFQISGLGGTAADNFGQSIFDFRLTSSGYDSDATGPFQSFTPNSPVAGLGPSLPSLCGCQSDGTGCGACSYTYQAMNVYDYDQALSGVALFNDTSGTPRLVTCDKAGYCYLMTQGNLCGSGTTDTACIGFDQYDPGSWTFSALGTPCQGAPDNCDRIPGFAVTDNHNTSGYWAIRLNYWPYGQRLTALALSDNTLQQGAGQLTSNPSVSAYSMKLAGTCTLDSDCLPEQVVPGDSISLDGITCPCQGQGGACPTVTSVNENSKSDSELTLNMTVTAAFGASCGFPQNFHYAGYFVAPAHDYTRNVPNAGYPGGMLTVSENCTVTPCTNQLIWAITPDSSSQPNTTTRGLGTLYAFTALPNTNDILTKDFASTDTWCASSFARPTVVNASAFVPTYAVSAGTRTFTACPTPTGSGNPYPSGLLRYY